MNIIELQYLGGLRVVLFKCDWRDVYNKRRGIKTDNYGFTSLNFDRSLQTNEPFILACQAEQVFYLREMGEPNWYVVQQSQPQDFYDMDTYKVTSDERFQQNDLSDIGQCSTQDVDLNDCEFSCHRSDIPLEISFEAGTSRQ